MLPTCPVVPCRAVSWNTNKHRTDSSYARWEEALKTWNEVRSLSKDLARQVRVLCFTVLCFTVTKQFVAPLFHTYGNLTEGTIG